MRETKDSGIEWIGEIPNEWGIGVIKNAYSIILGKMLSPTQTHHEQTLENYLCAANIKWYGIDTSIQKKMWFSRSEKQTYLLQNNDVMIMEGGLAGTSCLYKGELDPCYIQNSVHCCRAKQNFTNRFLYYWMNVVYNSGYIDNICNKATIQHYTKEKVMNTPFVIMSFSEQQRIADYLDRKCSRIDAVIERKQEVIEKLKAYKQSVITEAVTKGLNPDVPMKDSGIEWIGEIPIKWDVASFKKILIRNDGGLWGDEPYGQNDTLVLRSTEQTIDGKWDIQSPAYRDLSNISNLQEYLVKCGDLLITKSSGSDFHIGKTTVADEYIESLRCSFSNFIQRLRVCAKINPRYYWYILNSSIARGQFVYLQNSTSGIGNINSKNINEIKVPIPPFDMQYSIVDYLDRKCSWIDAVISRQQEVIEKLKAYKKSLIYEVVTGKKEV